ncbi:MAG: hypothetical protein ACTS1X_14575 [Parasphingopyxis sp.]|uniref:hypothetical protein n=1 Tax=Parasphingopyxis sp. TaxID=1920299 RepID=UPI003F9FCF54
MKYLGKTLMGATAATALAVAAPAQARDNDGIDAGDVIAGALILGGIAAVAAAVTDDDDDDRYERRHGRYDDYDRRYNRPYRQLRPRQAVRQCRRAARHEASRYGRARVTEITEVDRRRDGYRVEGRLLVEEGRYGRRGYYRTADYDRGRFTCRIRYGQIDRLRVRGLD